MENIIYNELINNYNHKKVLDKIKNISRALFNKKNVVISISGDMQTIDCLKNEMKHFSLPRKQYDKVLKVTLNEDKNHALIIPSGVSYNAMASSLATLNEKATQPTGNRLNNI